LLYSSRLGKENISDCESTVFRKSILVQRGQEGAEDNTGLVFQLQKSKREKKDASENS